MEDALTQSIDIFLFCRCFVCFFRNWFFDTFVRLFYRLDRTVFIEEHLVHAHGTTTDSAAFAIDGKRGVVVEKERVSFEIDHGGMDGETVPGGAGDLSAVSPRACDLFGCGVGDDFAALRILVIGIRILSLSRK